MRGAPVWSQLSTMNREQPSKELEQTAQPLLCHVPSIGSLWVDGLIEHLPPGPGCPMGQVQALWSQKPPQFHSMGGGGKTQQNVSMWSSPSSKAVELCPARSGHSAGR